MNVLLIGNDNALFPALDSFHHFLSRFFGTVCCRNCSNDEDDVHYLCPSVMASDLNIQVLHDELTDWAELLIIDHVYGRNTPYQFSTLLFVLEARRQHPQIAIIVLTDDMTVPKIEKELHEFYSKELYYGLAPICFLEKAGLIREPTTPNECKTVIDSERLVAIIKDSVRDQHEKHRMKELLRLIRENEAELSRLGQETKEYNSKLLELEWERDTREIKARKSGTQP